MKKIAIVGGIITIVAGLATLFDVLINNSSTIKVIYKGVLNLLVLNLPIWYFIVFLGVILMIYFLYNRMAEPVIQRTEEFPDNNVVVRYTYFYDRRTKETTLNWLEDYPFSLHCPDDDCELITVNFGKPEDFQCPDCAKNFSLSRDINNLEFIIKCKLRSKYS